MARSNGQGGQAGRPPQARQPAEPEFYAQPQQPAAGQYAPYPPAPVAYGAPQHPSAAPLARPQAGYPQQPGYYAPAAPPQHPQQQAYHEPAPAYPPQAAQSEHGYYAQPAAEPAHYAGANAGYPPQQPPLQPPHYPPPQPNAGYGAPQPPQQYAPQWAPQPAVDPRGYDLGHYAPVYEPQHQGHPHANYQQGYAEPQHYAPEPTWDGTRAGYAPPSAEPPHELGQYGAQPVHGHSQHAPQAQGYAEPHPDEYLDDDEEAEVEPRRRGRGLFVVAGLVCAIGAGAGLAYAYTQFARPGSGGGKPLILKADSQPSKARPDTATNTNGKLPNRLDERIAGAGSDAADDRANDDPNAPRKVRTTTFTMGQPAAGAPAAEPPPAAAAPKQTIGMRGVALDNVGPPPASLPGMLPPVTPAPPGMAVAPPPGKAAVPKAQPVARIATATTDAPKAAVPKVKTAAAAKKDADAFSPPATGATRSAVGAPPAGGSGFVAVVASAKSAGDALKAYADLRQKYGATLGDKAADVQASDQSARGLGMQYRAVVGPPGSRESASAVCAELKAAGHADCWITSF